MTGLEYIVYKSETLFILSLPCEFGVLLTTQFVICASYSLASYTLEYAS